MHALDAGLLVNAASGALMIALGAFVASVRGAGRANRAFALFAVPFGLTWIVDNLTTSAGHDTSPWRVTVAALLVLAAAGLARLAAVYPRPLRREDRHRVGIAVASGVLVYASWTTLVGIVNGTGLSEALIPPVVDGGVRAFHGTAWGVLVLFALRHDALRREDAADAAALRTMSVALVLYPAFFVARETVALLDLAAWPAVTPWGLVHILLPTTGLAALWLAHASRADAPAEGRRIAWVVLGAALAGVPAFGFGWNHPGYGVARTLGVAVLSYAVVRHQLLGIDVKVRWGISRGTVAAVFIAVFFVASEGAQEFLGETTGSSYLGIAAAGILVFAIVPLQRAAERIAERAVPVTARDGAPTPRAAAPDGDDPEDVYRNTLRLALGGTRPTREEERHLFRLARALHIDAARAHELVVELEREKERGS